MDLSKHCSNKTLIHSLSRLSEDLGPQPFNAVIYSEVFADGQLNYSYYDVETFILAGN